MLQRLVFLRYLRPEECVAVQFRGVEDELESEICKGS